MKPIFCGNFEYDSRQSDLERLFKRYGKVDRVDMKSGFAFVYMDDERDADDAIRALDQKEFGRKGRRLRVEWTKQERGIRRPESSKRAANTRPSKTLFVINFDPYSTRTRDLERHFDPYGKIANVRIRKNFAFVQFELQEDATRALDATNMSKLTDRVISVEYAVRDDDEKKNGYSPRGRHEGGHDKGRSPSPYDRERGSPDYGRGRSPSPYKRERGRPDYGRRRSPSPYRRDRATPDRVRDPIRSPYQKEKLSPENGYVRSRSPLKKERPGSSLRSPYRREKGSPDHRARSPYGRVRGSPNHTREPSGSPYGRDRRSPVRGRDPSNSPYERKKTSPDHNNGLGDGDGDGIYQREKAMASNDLDMSPNVRSGQGDSPSYDDGEIQPDETHRSQSPPLRGRSQSD